MRRSGFLIAFVLILRGSVSVGCEVGLLLLVDVSASVSDREFRVQIDGLSAALRSSTVIDGLVRNEAMVAVMQWTGSGRQAVSIPWTRIDGVETADELAEAVDRVERSLPMFATAIGQALTAAHRELEKVDRCTWRVIDISADGRSNQGIPPPVARDRLVLDGVTINALILSQSERNIVSYFQTEVIGGLGAFALLADTRDAYPEAMRRKLVREINIASWSAERPPIPN